MFFLRSLGRLLRLEVKGRAVFNNSVPEVKAYLVE